MVPKKTMQNKKQNIYNHKLKAPRKNRQMYKHSYAHNHAADIQKTHPHRIHPKHI